MGTSPRMNRGTVVLVRFPFSDLSASNLRPAVILASVSMGGIILVQITSNPYSDARAIKLIDADFEAGSLDRVSYARPGKLFAANEALIARSVGSLTNEAAGSLVSAVVRLLQGES